MQKITNLVCFKTNFMEPVIVSGKTFGIKLLSAYDFILFIKKFNSLKKFLKLQRLNSKICKNISEKASLISLCLYKSENEKLFPDAITVLKTLTFYEIRYIYNEYVKLYNRVTCNDKKINSILEKVKNNYTKSKNSTISK